MDDGAKGLPHWVLPLVSWLVAAYFLIGYLSGAGFPPSSDIAVGQAVLLAIGLFFLFLPFFSRVKIGKWLELEREVGKTKTELRDFKQDVQASLALITTSVNTISSLSNSFVVNLPGAAELAEARQDLDRQATPETRQEAQDIRDELTIEGEVSALTLARMRMRLEYLLRKIADDHRGDLGFSEEEVRRMPLRQLFRAFARIYPQYRDFSRSFDYVTRIANAAIHAQPIPFSQAQDAVDMGAELIALLGGLADDGDVVA